LYENEEATVSTLEKVVKRIAELAEYESSFRRIRESLATAQAVLEDLAFAVRDFRGSLEYSPERLEEIENRLAEISRLKRKYGGAIETVLQHFKESEERLRNIETADLREEELRRELKKAREEYFKIARRVARQARKSGAEI
jgi:DNA repair protein RecN (Recombination protein N)